MSSIKKEKNLSDCAIIFDYIGDIDSNLINKIFNKAKKNKDIKSFNGIIRSISRNFPRFKEFNQLLLNSIKELTKLNSYNWVNYASFHKDSIFKTFEEKDFDIILNNLILKPNIDYQSEDILSHIVEIKPEKIIEFFNKRINFKIKNEEKNEYDAIPFKLHIIGPLLESKAEKIIPEISKWYLKRNPLFHWEASHLLRIIFPEISDEFKKVLLHLIQKGGNKNNKIVFKEKLFVILSQTGTVGGEDGFIREYERKKEELKGWKKDKNEAINKFAKEYEDFLNKRINYEEKRVKEKIELSKRDFEIKQ